MIRINQLKLSFGASPEVLKKKAAGKLKIPVSAVRSINIRRYSIDARKKPDLYEVYTIDAEVDREKEILNKNRDPNVGAAYDVAYRFPDHGNRQLEMRPVIAGAGPAGLFCGYMLARYGYRPILLERGRRVEERTADVENFWKTGVLDPDSNVQFGEGGAGTFSDGKLNTQVKDTYGRNRKVLEIFCEAGAPEEICYLSHPHVGTDRLTDVIRNIRNDMIAHGGTIRYEACVTGIEYDSNGIRNIVVNGKEWIPAEIFIPAIGHSARDTFFMLQKAGVPMQAKSFAVGVRVEHSQEKINLARYGRSDLTADYKLTANLANGRGVYSFCMCPGGYVVNASSEENALAVNGMSFYMRDSKNANSAVVVTVTPDDFGITEGYPPELQGIAFQRKLEKKSFEAGNGAIPVQLLKDYRQDRKSIEFGDVLPEMKGNYRLSNVRRVLPKYIGDSILEGIDQFDHKISGFAADDTLISGVESRTSSPVRILRDENFESSIKGVFPCGEGAGYAGGIMSAAMDGIRIAEEIARRYQPFSQS